MRRNKIDIKEHKIHLIGRIAYYKPESTERDIYVVAFGQCNDKDFGAVLQWEIGITSYLLLVSTPDICFNKSEFDSIRRKLKGLINTENCVTYPVPAPRDDYIAQRERLYLYVEEKILGPRVVLNVPQEERHLAQQIGARWDGFNWYLHEELLKFHQNIVPVHWLSNRQDAPGCFPSMS